MSVVNSHTNWSPLEEVWLGDVYPATWYDHLPSEIRDCFYELTERTQEDLNFIEQKLKSLGVTVCRPYYDRIDNYIDSSTQQLIKPEICPRDYYVTIGQTLFAIKPWRHISPWRKYIDSYKTQGAKVDHVLTSPNLRLAGASTVRAGKDLYFDLGYQTVDKSKELLVDSFNQTFAEKFKEYRVHLLFNGGHTDGCFSLLKPGVIMSSKYFDDYARTFPSWQLINTTEPEFWNHAHQRKKGSPFNNSKWWLPEMSHSQAFNKHIIEHAQNWIGDYTETFFEINCLVIDEHNVVIPGENEKVFRFLEQLGITAHPVPFRTRTFWDGGMHCITLDIRRQGVCEDFFPERGESKITIYD